MIVIELKHSGWRGVLFLAPVLDHYFQWRGRLRPKNRGELRDRRDFIHRFATEPEERAEIRIRVTEVMDLAHWAHVTHRASGQKVISPEWFTINRNNFCYRSHPNRRLASDTNKVLWQLGCYLYQIQCRCRR